MANLPPLPLKTPLINPNMITNRIWAQWFQGVVKKFADSSSIALINSKYASVSGAYEYTTPNNLNTVISSFTVTNADASAQTISVYLVPSGGTAGPSNIIISAHSVAAGATDTLSGLADQTLNAGDKIYVIASVANKLTIRCSGREVA